MAFGTYKPTRLIHRAYGFTSEAKSLTSRLLERLLELVELQRLVDIYAAIWRKVSLRH